MVDVDVVCCCVGVGDFGGMCLGGCLVDEVRERSGGGLCKGRGQGEDRLGCAGVEGVGERLGCAVKLGEGEVGSVWRCECWESDRLSAASEVRERDDWNEMEEVRDARLSEERIGGGCEGWEES